MQTDALAAMAGLRAAFDAFAACDVASLSRSEVVALLDEYEELMCQLPAPLHRLLAQLQAGTTPKEMGAKSWNAVLRIRWRLSTAEAGRRLHEAAELGPRRALTGEPLAPVLGVVAAAQAAGLINADHVKVLRATRSMISPGGSMPPRGTSSKPIWWGSRSRWGPRSSRTPPSCGCFCSIRTAPSPTTPNAPVPAGCRWPSRIGLG